jgi:hypothetical protein
MHDPQQNERLAAARAFMESLDQLQNILAHESQTSESESHWQSEHASSDWDDPMLLEDAAADLDEFFGDAQSQEELFGEES